MPGRRQERRKAELSPELRASPESLSAAAESVADVGSRAWARPQAIYTVPSGLSSA